MNNLIEDSNISKKWGKMYKSGKIIIKSINLREKLPEFWLDLAFRSTAQSSKTVPAGQYLLLSTSGVLFSTELP